MQLIANTKYAHNQEVLCRFKNFKPNEIVKGRITWIYLSQSSYFRPDAFLVSYRVTPVEMDEFEHDDDETIPECHVNCKDLPTFIE